MKEKTELEQLFEILKEKHLQIVDHEDGTCTVTVVLTFDRDGEVIACNGLKIDEGSKI